MAVPPGPLPPLHVPALYRHPHLEAVEVLGELDLARKAAGSTGAGGEVEHIFLVLDRRGQPVEPFGRDDHVTGGAGHLALAGAFERHARSLRDIEQDVAGRRRGFDAFAVACNENDPDDGYPCCDAA